MLVAGLYGHNFNCVNVGPVQPSQWRGLVEFLGGVEDDGVLIVELNELGLDELRGLPLVSEHFSELVFWVCFNIEDHGLLPASVWDVVAGQDSETVSELNGLCADLGFA